jgi:hypothetical protein
VQTGLRFLFRVTLRRHDLAAEVWHIKEPERLPPVLKPRVEAFVQRLRELGWIEGRTVAIEYRWAEGRTERFAQALSPRVRFPTPIATKAGPDATAPSFQVGQS